MVSIVNYQNIVSLSLSDEADTGSGGDRPARNSLTEWNGKGGQNILLPFFLFQSIMPKKTHCFDRSKSEKRTIINLKKGQHIPGQDILRREKILLTENDICGMNRKAEN